MSQLYANNASALLISDLLVADTTITLAPGAGDQFPLPDAGDPDSFSMLTLEDVGGNIEIVQMTERSGDILTIVRGQESTTPAGFATGSRVEARLTAGSLDNFKQVTDQYELRGNLIESDGLRLWHQQDPSTYQFFTLRYYTFDALGVPWLHLEAPPGVTGLSIWNSVTAPDGSTRGAGLVQDTDLIAPLPGTGEVSWSVPGQLRMGTITDPVSSPLMFQSFENDVPTSTFKYQFAANKTNPISYEFRTRDEFEVEKSVLFNKDGSLTATRSLQIVNGREGTYPNADPVNMLFLPGIVDAGTTDYLYIQGDDHGNRIRELGYWWSTRYKVPDSDPVEYASAQILFTAQGNIYSSTPPTDDEHLTNKAYVDTSVTNATSGAGLNTLAADLYGRTVLWNDDAGTNDGSTKTLTGGAFSDFYEIEVTGRDEGNNKFYSMCIDTQTLADKGYSTGWVIVPNKGTGQDNRLAYFNPKSDTTFTADHDSASDAKVVRVLGKFPKNAGGV
jgi:hypothetical protein